MIESVGATLVLLIRKTSYEATLYDNVLTALDILVKDQHGWKAYEVKSSTKVSDTYIMDAAYNTTQLLIQV